MFPFWESVTARAAYPTQYNYFARNKAASIASVKLIPAPIAGLYRISVYIATNTPGTGNVSTTFSFTDDVGVETIALPGTFAFNAGTAITGGQMIQVASGAISFSTTYVPSGSYNIYAVLEKII